MAGKVFDRVRGLLLWAAVLLAAASPWVLLRAQDPSPINNSQGPMQGLQSFSSPGFSLDTTTPTQQGAVTVSASTVGTATVTSFDTSRTILLVSGCDTSAAESSGLGQHTDQNRGLLTITNATTITATMGANPGTAHCGFSLIQFGVGVVNSLQACSITLTSVTSATCAITAVNTARAVAIYQGETLGGVNPVTSDVAEARVDLSDSTHCRATRVTSTANSDSVGCLVVEFK